MAFEDYDVGKAFERIEAELIDSMMRNLGRHLKEEDAEGFDWPQWQAEQLKALDEYRRRNKKHFGPQFRQINKRIEQAIRHANASGQKDEEKRILEALSKNKKIERKYANRKASIEAGGDAFFRVNDRKLNALVEATHHDMTKAEHAVLRRTNDQYRKIIFDAQVYANTGAGTVEKAIDMATKDFLSRGIDCIVYSNGARHSISDYADMCIRTAERRAYLAGEGVKRQEWGIATVIVGKRGTMSGGDHGTACPHCIPWLGKVLIDDVWSGGEAWINGEDRQRSKGAEAEPMGTSPITGAKYPLMSAAIAAGLYHPRCKDGHTTYFEELEDLDDDMPKPATKEDVQEAVEAEKEENKKNREKRQAEKQDRKAKNNFDQDNRIAARHKANQWKEQAAPFKPAETIEEAQEYAQRFCKQNFMDRTFKGQVDFKGISLEHANAINRSLTEAYSRFPEMEKLSGIKAVAPGSRQGKKAFKDGADALFSYSPIEHGIFINKDVLKNPQTLDAYMQQSKDAWDLVMNNLDKLSGRQRELAERYANAGRDLVSGDTVEGLFTHELGHHVQWTMLDPKTTNSITSRMQQYAPHLSGYATASNSEYLAESFVAYMKGETDLLDPEYVDILNSKINNISAGETEVLDREYKLEPEDKKNDKTKEEEWNKRLEELFKLKQDTQEEAESEKIQDADLLGDIRRLFQKKEDLSKMTDRARDIAQTEDLPSQMRKMNTLIDDYVKNPSNWSGKVFVDDSISGYGKYSRKTGDITLSPKALLKTKIHELLHARTIYKTDHLTSDILKKNKPLNEGLTELLAQKICEKEGIDIIYQSYKKWVKSIKDIARCFKVDEYDFALVLLDTPYEERYAFIKHITDMAKANNELSSEEKTILERALNNLS